MNWLNLCSTNFHPLPVHRFAYCAPAPACPSPSQHEVEAGDTRRRSNRIYAQRSVSCKRIEVGIAVQNRQVSANC